MVTLWNSNMAMENPSIIDVYVNLRGFPVAMFDYWRVFFWFKNIKQLLVQIPIFWLFCTPWIAMVWSRNWVLRVQWLGAPIPNFQTHPNITITLLLVNLKHIPPQSPHYIIIYIYICIFVYPWYTHDITILSPWYLQPSSQQHLPSFPQIPKKHISPKQSPHLRQLPDLLLPGALRPSPATRWHHLSPGPLVLAHGRVPQFPAGAAHRGGECAAGAGGAGSEELRTARPGCGKGETSYFWWNLCGISNFWWLQSSETPNFHG